MVLKMHNNLYNAYAKNYFIKAYRLEVFKSKATDFSNNIYPFSHYPTIMDLIPKQFSILSLKNDGEAAEDLLERSGETIVIK